MKYLATNLIRYLHYLQAENYKTVVKKIKEYLDGETVRVRGLEDNTVKMSLIFKLIYSFNKIQSKFSQDFNRYKQNDCKLHIVKQKSRIDETILKKKTAEDVTQW